MDDRQIGRLYRAVRTKLNLRQADVGARARVDQGIVSDLELGRLEAVGLGRARRVASVLGIRLFLTAQWQGGDGDRLLDRAHASIVDYVVGVLRDAAWDVIPEFTFNVYGDRGSVDVLAWHPRERILLIICRRSRGSGESFPAQCGSRYPGARSTSASSWSLPARRRIDESSGNTPPRSRRPCQPEPAQCASGYGGRRAASPGSRSPPATPDRRSRSPAGLVYESGPVSKRRDLSFRAPRDW